MSAPKKIVRVNINCPAIANIANLRVKRAGLFLGLGLQRGQSTWLQRLRAAQALGVGKV
jgi:hypothetical protein